MEKDIVIIDEKTYQQIKKIMGKTNDYFTIEEWKKFIENRRNLGER